MEDKDELSPDQWSDQYDFRTGFKCQMPVEYESERMGDFRLFRQDCSHKTKPTYQVRDAKGFLLESHKDIKSAKNDINERYAQVLKNQYNADKKDIQPDTGNL